MKRSWIVRQVFGLQVGGGGEVALQEGAGKGGANKRGAGKRGASERGASEGGGDRKIDSGYLSLLVIVRGLKGVIDRVVRGFFNIGGIKKKQFGNRSL